MADIDLLNIEPNIITKDMRGRTITVFASPKAGKTTFACSFPDSLLLAFERGYTAIPGVIAQDIATWSEFRKVLKQLKSDEVKARFANIIVDTADLWAAAAEKYVCIQAGVEAIGDVAYGKLYGVLKKELLQSVLDIVHEGYGLIFISHEKDKTFEDETGQSYQKLVPSMSNQALEIVTGQSDVIGYGKTSMDEEGVVTRKLYLRETPRFMAGSRFAHMAPVIDFSYESFKKALYDAIDAEDGDFVTTAPSQIVAEAEFKPRAIVEAKADVQDLILKVQENTEPDYFKNEWAGRIKDIIEKHLGTGKRLADATQKQIELVEDIYSDLLDAINEGL